jgi:predicted small lipoprotein YifL
MIRRSVFSVAAGSKALLAAGAFALLAGCGQKGALTLPAPKQPASAPAAAR